MNTITKSTKPWIRSKLLLILTLVFSSNILTSAYALKRISDHNKVHYSSNACTTTHYNNGVTAYQGRVNIQKEIIDQSCIIDHEYVPVGFNKPYSLMKVNDGIDSFFQFRMKGQEDNLLSKNRGRIELSDCYADESNLLNHLQKNREIPFMSTIHDMYRHCEGELMPGNTRWFSFKFRLPENTNNPDYYKDLSVIIAQWHGKKDRLLYKDHHGSIKTLSKLTPGAYNRIITRGGVFESSSGGPPIALKIADGKIFLLTRNDPAPFSDVTKRCHISNRQIEHMDLESDRHCLEADKSVNILYSNDLHSQYTGGSGLPLGEWITMTFEVKFSSYENRRAGILDITPGTLRLWVNKDSGDVPDVDWQGSLGGNDEHGVYFKFGIYRVGNNVEPTTLQFKDVIRSDQPIMGETSTAHPTSSPTTFQPTTFQPLTTPLSTPSTEAALTTESIPDVTTSAEVEFSSTEGIQDETTIDETTIDETTIDETTIK
ncbi:MAG: heparin lyase I family protein, partial [Endozoicomonas sp.]